jgi:ribonuclease HI
MTPKITIFTDGGARGNPGPAGIGVVIKKDKQTIFSHSGHIGQATNNIAEYQAINKALEWLENHPDQIKGAEEINCYLDSLLVVSQLSGKYKIKAPHLVPLAAAIKAKEKKLKIKITYHHIPRWQNIEADTLVNQALDRQMKTQ